MKSTNLQSEDEALKQKRELELNKEVVSMIKDSYFRITVVNLDKNLVENVKLRDAERKMEQLTVEYDKTMMLCARNFVHPEDKEKFLQISDSDYVRNAFLSGQKEVSFTYRRLIDGVDYKWVQSILIPISSDFKAQPVFIWYIKNIDAEKAREKELSDQLVQTNADLTVLLGNIAQYQRAVMSDAFTTYNINISQDKILNYDAKSKTDATKEVEIPLVPDGTSYEKFIQSFLNNMTEESKGEFAKICSCDKLIECFYQGTQQIEAEYRCYDKCGHVLYFKHRILLAQEKITRDILGLCYIKDMTKVRETDNVTGVFNREGFFNQVRFYLQNRNSKYAVVYFNLKGFKSLNYILGPIGADNILKQYAQVLLSSYLKPLVTARLEIDHFACLVEEKNLDLKRILALTKCDFLYEKTSISVNTLVGIYRVEDINISPAEMYENAKIASKHIQDEYLRPYAFFKDQMQNDVLSKADVLSRVDEALINGEFQVYIQPIVDAKTGYVVSGEALIRWEYEGKQLISPAKFIPALEEEGRISQLDLYVVKQVRNLQRLRQQAGKKQVPISINLSWMDFFNEEMMDWIVRDIQSFELPSQHIRFEITETSYAAVLDKRKEVLQQLRESGVSILLDDFGSGYSSFSTLQAYDFDIIKLDMGFVRKIDTDKKARVIIKSLIYMAHMMDSRVIAEGVETKSQADFLRREGCDYIQGYYYGKPMRKEEFEKLLDEEDFRTELFENNQKAAVLNEELNYLYNTVPAAYYRCSNLEDFKLLYVSEYFLQMLGYTRLEIKTEFEDHFLELVHPDDKAVIYKAIKEFYEDSKEKECVFRLKSKMGYIWVQNQMKKIIRQDEIYFAGILLNVSHFKLQEADLEKLSYQDVLTKVYNRRRFEEDIRNLSLGEYSCVACMYLDAIGLHEVNNHFGHAAGDELLCAVANQMLEAFPKGDIYRIGGDEFTVLIKDVSEEKLKKQALRLRKKLEIDGNDVSIGVEWREGIVKDGIEFIDAAEAKMRTDKKFYYAQQGIGRKMRALEHTFNRTMMEQHAAVQFMDTVIQDYLAVYCVDLKKDVVRHIYISEHKGKFIEQALTFSEASKLYVEEYLDEENQKIYLSLLDYSKIIEQREIKVYFTKKDGVKVLLRIVMIGKESDSTESLWMYSKVDENI